MISSYNSTTQVVDTGSAYVFDTNRVFTGCTVSHTPGTTTFTLNKPGYYYVTFNTTFTTTETGDATVELRNGGIAIPGASASATITTIGNVKSLAFATIVRVLPSCAAIDNTANLTFVATGIAPTVTIANVNITKLC